MSGFKLIARQTEEVPTRDRNDFRDEYLTFRAGDGFEVAMPLHVVHELHALGRRAAPNEFLGLVYGLLAEDPAGRHVVIDGIVPIEGATATAVTVSSTPHAAAIAEGIAEERFPGARRLGWAHSHPGYGPEFSGVDEANQSSYLSPTAIGIVVDPWCPIEHGLAVYRGPKSERLLLVHPVSSPRAGTTFRPIAPLRSPVPTGRNGGPRKTRRWITVALVVANVAMSAAGAAAVSVRLAEHARRLAALEQVARREPAPAESAVPGAPVLLGPTVGPDEILCADLAAPTSTVIDPEPAPNVCESPAPSSSATAGSTP